MTHKKKSYRHQLGPMTHFLTTPKFDLLLYIGEKCVKKTLFLSLFLEKRGQIGKKSKKLLRASTADHDLFFHISHIWPTFIFGVSNAPDTFFFTFSMKNRSNNKIFEKQNLWASTRSHDPFFDNPKIWPTFIYRGEVLAHTFAKLSVRALITDLKKFDPKKIISVKTPHLAMWSTSLSRPKYFGTSPKLPVHALIHDP